MKQLQEILSLNKHKDIVYLCIGSESHVWDSLGPFVGTLLNSKGFKNVYGVIGQSVNSSTIEHYRNKIYSEFKKPFVIAVDAAITNDKEKHKTIKIVDSGIKPGSALSKNIEEIGDISILGVIHKDSFDVNKNIAAPFLLANKIVDLIEDNVKNQEVSALKRCKYCKGTELLAEVTETRKIPAKIVDGEIVETYWDQSEVTTSKTKICFCCTCNKEITDKDIIEKETCVICGKEVNKVIDGKCESCHNILKEVASPEELLAKIMHGEIKVTNKKGGSSRAKSNKTNNKTEPSEVKEVKEVKEEEVKEVEKEITESMNNVNTAASAINNESVEVDETPHKEVVDEVIPDTDISDEINELVGIIGDCNFDFE